MRRYNLALLIALVFMISFTAFNADARKRDNEDDEDDLENDSASSILSAPSLSNDFGKISPLWATDAPAATAPTPTSRITMPTYEIETTGRVDIGNLEEDESASKIQSNENKPSLTNDPNHAIGNNNNRPTVSTSIGVIRNLLKKEVRKLKSVITDSIMEEVINYYGKKLDSTDILARDMEKVNNRLNMLEENVTVLNQNYKQLLKNHRNLVDMVRNNFVSSKKEKKLSSMSTLVSDQSGSNLKNPASSVFATIITDLLLNNNRANNNRTNINNKSTVLSGTDLEAMTLRNHLINDLDTKYANLVNQNLMGMISKSYNANNTNVPAVTPLDTSTLHQSQPLQLVEETESEKAINFSTLLPKKGKSAANGDTRKIVVRNQDKKQSASRSKKKSSSLRHKHVDQYQHSNNNESSGIEDSMRSSKEQFKLKKYHKIQNTTSISDEIPTDCQGIRESGVYKNGVYKVFSPILNNSFDVYCEFEGNIGWTLLQHRFDGTTSFHQNWNAYKKGFGNLIGEFWLGLDYMNALTSQKNCSLQIIMTDWKNEIYRAEYTHFKVDDEKSKYKLEISGYVKETSNAGDSLAGGDDSTASASNSANSHHHSAAYTAGNMDPIRNTPAPLGQSHQNMPFSTYDSDNDMRFYDNCAQLFKSGWWFNQCFQANLNGIYYTYKNAFQQQQIRFLRNGLHWNSIDFYKSLKSTKMRIKPLNA